MQKENAKLHHLSMKIIPMSIVLLTLFVSDAFAQRPLRIVNNLLFELNWNNWTEAPPNVTLQPIRNRGFTFHSMIPLAERKHLHLATGVGISNTNIFNREVRRWNFLPNGSVSDLYNINLKKNKLSLTYAEIPLQVILRPADTLRTPKLTLGFKGGILIDNHTKVKDGSGEISKIKRFDGVNLFRYGPFARLGFGRWHLHGFYAFSPVFDKENAPDIQQYSIGVTFSGL
jgi:hypothetical protein